MEGKVSEVDPCAAQQPGRSVSLRRLLQTDNVLEILFSKLLQTDNVLEILFSKLLQTDNVSEILFSRLLQTDNVLEILTLYFALKSVFK